MSRGHRAVALAALTFACHGGSAAPATLPPLPPAVGRMPPPFAADSEALSAPAVPPRFAHLAGFMPLASSGVDQFRARHPTYDGRGVVIGILDSGIDPGAVGLQVTTTGAPKILDLRDFSDEGRVSLTPVTRSTTGTISIGGHTLSGVGRVARLASGSAWYGGVLRESRLGRVPGADLNGDGSNVDDFPVVVVKATDGWVVFLDTNLNGSFDDETPLHDYRDGRQTIALGTKPLTLAVNLVEANGAPSLDFVFDNASHGTHVAGVAAGHGLFDIPEFDGVAPGAQLLGLKITDNGRGGMSVTGSIARALAYAARFAEQRGLPLVLNLSFAIGTDHRERAALDSLVDAFLAAHPGVVFTVAAGNDGPGLSTLGSPAAADLVLAVGAALPVVFARPLDNPASSGEDLMGWWSARGGEVDKPDILAPGLAFSTVPRFATGQELKRGTSVAAPYGAGMAACLVSAMAQEGRAASAAEIVAALRASATPFAGTTTLDRGAGEPRLEAAYRWLGAGHQGSSYLVRTAAGGSAAFRRGTARPDDTLDVFRVRHLAGLRAAQFTLHSTVPWLTAPATISAGPRETEILVRTTPPPGLAPGVYTGAVTARNPSDTLAGPLFTLVSTVIVAYDLTTKPLSDAGRTVGAGRVQRYFLRVPGGGATLQATVILPESLGSRATVRLYDPSGQPPRAADRPSPERLPPGSVSYVVRAEDIVPGVYELDVAAPPLSGLVAQVRAELAPLELNETNHRLEVSNPGPLTLTGTARQALLGAERAYTVAGKGAAAETLSVHVPAWAASVTIDVDLAAPLWRALTGFGVTEFDSTGQQVAESPLNYAFGRQRVHLPAALAGRPLSIELDPAFARLETPRPWEARVRVRFLLPYEQPLGSETQVAVVSGGRVALPAVSGVTLALPEGFEPLVEARVRAGAAGSVEAVRRIAVPVGHP